MEKSGAANCGNRALPALSSITTVILFLPFCYCSVSPCLSFSLSLPVSLSLFLSVFLSLCLCVSLSVFLSVSPCLSVSVSL